MQNAQSVVNAPLPPYGAFLGVKVQRRDDSSRHKGGGSLKRGNLRGARDSAASGAAISSLICEGVQ